MSPISIRICVQYLVAVRRSCREKRGYCCTCVVLKYYGISPQALNRVRSFLTNRTQQVLLEGNMSSSINVTSGVPQGSVLGPLLFLIYINDLPDYIQNNSTVKLFADDTIIYHPINNQQDSVALQEDLTPYSGGSQTGSCTSTHKNAKPCTSPTNVTSSNPHTPYTTTNFKQPTQPNT